MFEIGFQEILLIFVIALVVLGPERLPKLVAQVGRWAGKARAMARQFREQLESEINLDELNKAAKAKPVTPDPVTPEPPKPWEETPAADAPVIDPSAPVSTAPAPAMPDPPFVAPDDDFAHHPQPAVDDIRSSADQPVVSTHERL